ncbi:hypothetical protein Cph01nite_28490 [Cellulomonas phragmiteti]|uniref:Uncharacterized protein n=1 Tax=Cellulomonas phragmiteti TaxID=478780 RepID=A0ABQ4DP03_9CELL|nr:hypothetical protein Cph01nite_28490 [Cellulomonas phragmiteti]
MSRARSTSAGLRISITWCALLVVPPVRRRGCCPTWSPTCRDILSRDEPRTRPAPPGPRPGGSRGRQAGMWCDGWSDIVRGLLVGTAAYVTLVVPLRVLGEPTPAELRP